MKPDQEKAFAEIKDLSTEDKVKSLIAMIDTPIGRRKYPLEMILLAKSPKRRSGLSRSNTRLPDSYLRTLINK